MKREFVIFVGNLTGIAGRRLDNPQLSLEGRVKFGILFV
jgi:hypothetical protein